MPVEGGHGGSFHDPGDSGRHNRPHPRAMCDPEGSTSVCWRLLALFDAAADGIIDRTPYLFGFRLSTHTFPHGPTYPPEQVSWPGGCARAIIMVARRNSGRPTTKWIQIFSTVYYLQNARKSAPCSTRQRGCSPKESSVVSDGSGLGGARSGRGRKYFRA